MTTAKSVSLHLTARQAAVLRACCDRLPHLSDSDICKLGLLILWRRLRADDGLRLETMAAAVELGIGGTKRRRK